MCRCASTPMWMSPRFCVTGITCRRRWAKDATPPGGEILVSTLRDGDFVTIRVTDTGAGIAEQQIHKVLEPYFSTKKGGTGLGLPTVHRVAEEHGGTLTVQSEPGKGTQFSLQLPIRQSDPGSVES
jgi:two-component system, NtrC family, sensor histidine kinase HydH